MMIAEIFQISPSRLDTPDGRILSLFLQSAMIAVLLSSYFGMI